MSSDLATSMAPRYVDFKEQIRTEMFTVKQRMNDLRQLHGRAVLTNFDDTDSSDAEIEVITQEITRLLRKCEARLQQFTAGAPGSEVDEKVCPYLHPHKITRCLKGVDCLSSEESIPQKMVTWEALSLVLSPRTKAAPLHSGKMLQNIKTCFPHSENFNT